jgi:hypothetical protein
MYLPPQLYVSGRLAMVLVLFLSAILFALMFPETPTGRFAKRHFVDAPANWLNNISPVKVFALIGVAVLVAVCSTAFPAEVALIAAGDLTAYFEIAVTLAVLASKLRIRQFASRAMIVTRQALIGARCLSKRLHVRVRRSRLRRHAKPQSSDEDGGMALA